MANPWQAFSQEEIVDLQVSGLLLLQTALHCMPLSQPSLLIIFRNFILTPHSPMSAYQKENVMAGCVCLNHWGSAQSSDLAPLVRVLQPRQTCRPPGYEDFPSCRVQSFENDMIDCDCTAWLKDNSFAPYQDNNPCLDYPIPTTIPATCSYT